MRPFKWLFWLAVFGVVAYGGWRGSQWALAAWRGASAQAELIARLDSEVKGLRARTEEVSRRQVDLSLAQQKAAGDAASLTTRTEAAEQNVLKLSDAVEGGRTRLQLAAVEQLLLAAAERLQLARDFSAALQTLDLADQRLALLNDPRLFKVREALRVERAALAAAGMPDVTGVTIALNELLRLAPKLPLAGRAAEHYETPDIAAAAPEDGSSWARVWAATKTALSTIFALHRTDAPPRWLPAEQQALVSQVLQLKLEGARLALLARDGPTLRELAGGAHDWLQRYYDESDPTVKGAGVQLEALRRLNLSPPLPEIGRSLNLLRAVLDSR